MCDLTGHPLTVDWLSTGRLHWAALYGQLDKVPRRLLTFKTLSLRDEAGLNVFDQAAISGTLSQLPKKQLTRKALTFRHEDTWETPLHWAAKFGHLDQVPENVLTDRTILMENRDAMSPLHIAGGNGFLSQLPERLLHPGNMLNRGGDGTAPFDSVRVYKHLDQLPLDVLCICRHEVEELFPEDTFRDLDEAITLRAMQEPARSLDEV